MRPISVGISPTAGVTTTAYTVPTGYYALFNLLYVHNTGGSTKHITVQWYDASAATAIDILTAVTYSSKSYTQFSNAYIVFEEGDQLRLTPEAASSFAVIATFEQIGLTRQ
jgi:hypothetical protein